MVLLLAAIVALTGLILAPGQFFYFDITPKVVVLLVGTAGAAFWSLSVGQAVPPVQTVPKPFLRLVESVASHLSLGFGALLLLNLLSLAVSTALSGHANLALYGGTWRRFGLVEQAALMLFAWMVARHCAARPGRRQDDPAWRGPGGGRERGVWHRPIFRMGPDPSRVRRITSARACGPSCVRRALWDTPVISPPGC